MKSLYLLFFVGLSAFLLTGCIQDAERSTYSVPVPIWATGDGDLAEDWGEGRAGVIDASY
ncbi:MAG: hypothetical protein EPN84_02290 [Legionella sp.]|nr:MAG: hypothetical protein EPN84_02290 [Legionella sp.]